MSTEHTPGRLNVVIDGTCSGAWPHMKADDGTVIFEGQTSHIQTEKAIHDDGPAGSYLERPYRFKINGDTGHRSLADARRLVACWNACDGLSTENLEGNIPVKELARRYNAALRQREELLTALKDLADSATEVVDATDDELREALNDGDPETRCQAGAFLQARATIAKVEGGSAPLRITGSGFDMGVSLAMGRIQARLDAFILKHGVTDPVTHVVSFGRGPAARVKEEVFFELTGVINDLNTLAKNGAQA
jgi:hypothetical protein